MQEGSGKSGSKHVEALIQAARAGDESAFGRLVEVYQSPLRAFLRNLSNQEVDLADDLSQDTFMLAFRQIHQFRGEGSFLSWLMGIGYRRFLQHARKNRRRKDLLEGTAELRGGWVSPPGTLTIDIERALARLGLEEKTALLLKGREGFTQSEIAEVMSLPLGTVKSHLARGRDKLKHILSGNEGNE